MAAKAFPSAYGFGADTTTGGRGGTVLFIDNLNNSGTGSARAAFEASGPRIIIPRVGGTINLTSAITITDPFCTFAGQVAPGGGIYFNGVHGGSTDTYIRIHTHDVILRHLRVRAYSSADPPLWESTPMLVWGSTNPVYNVVLDHCTMCWATDENLDIFGDCRDVTIQWCLIADPRVTGDPDGAPPSYPAPGFGSLIGSNNTKASVFSVSLHHTVFANNKGRAPSYRPYFTTTGGVTPPWGVFDFRNNLVSTWNVNNWSFIGRGFYNVGTYNNWVATFPAQPFVVGNWVGNHWIKGATGVSANDVLTVGPDTQTYMANNLGPASPSIPLDGFSIQVTHNARRYDGDSLSPYFFHHGAWDNTGFESLTPFTAPAIEEQDATEILALLTTEAGATLPAKDTQWTDIMNAVIANNSTFGDKTNAPTLASGTYPTHSQPDGIPDTWKTANGLDTGTDYTGVNAPNGYDWVENYINETAGDTIPLLTASISSIVDALTATDTASVVIDAPINNVPGSHTVVTNTQTAISGLSVTCAQGNLTSVRLTVLQGTLDATAQGGATIT